MPDLPYRDEDLVYVDPETRTVLGHVTWMEDGTPSPLPMKGAASEEEEETPPKGRKERRRRPRYYPWGTYRTMKRIYRIEGKERDDERRMSLDAALTKALQEPYWD
jgi:hypothetical protein